MMQKKIYYRLIVIPILLIVTVVSFITVYNINTWEKYKKEVISELTVAYTKRNKEKVEHDVHHFINDIEYIKKEHHKELKKRIKNKVNKLTSSLKSDYIYNKNMKSTAVLKEELLNIVRSQNKHGSDNYFFVLDIDSSEALVHNISSLEGKKVREKKDVRGTYTFKSKVAMLKNKNESYQTLYFEKPTNPNEQFEKIVYFTKFKYFNWIIGTGVYIKDEEKKIQKKIIEKYNTIQTNLSNYIFVSEVHNIDGGIDFATIRVMPNKRELIGKKISDNNIETKVKNYRKTYLKLLKKEGKGYVDYWYKKPNSQKQGRKESYMYLYKPWNWIVGSGFYFDDLETQIKHKEKIISEEVKDKAYKTFYTGLFFIFISMIVFYTFAKNIVAIIDKYIDRIAKQKNTFKALFENTSDGIILIQDGYFYNCNQAILDMFGFESKRKSIIGKRPCDLSPEVQENGTKTKEKTLEYMEKCLAGEDVNFQWKHQRKNGEIFDVEVTFTKIILENDEIIHAVLRDMSQKNALEKEAKQKDSILIQQSKMASMGEMIGNIAHQWRQPLNALGLTIQKIKMYHDEDMLTSKELDKSVAKSQMLINKMSVTIDDFRNFFKVNKVKSQFSINEAIHNTFVLLESSLAHHNIKLTVVTKDEITLLGYKNELEQVLLNLINNAKDALIDNHISNPNIEIILSHSPNIITIEINDNANGVPAHIIDKIFEPYFTTKEQGKGTGIGLYMSKMIIENNMEGVLKVKNIEKGASFIVQLKKESINE